MTRVQVPERLVLTGLDVEQLDRWADDLGIESLAEDAAIELGCELEPVEAVGAPMESFAGAVAKRRWAAAALFTRLLDGHCEELRLDAARRPPPRGGPVISLETKP